jgi:signal transduction histidine kinase
LTAIASQSAIETGTVGPAELAELMYAFNEVTTRLQGTHESLHREVTRLKAELHEANEQLQRSRRLAALGEMAAGIAHEVRNPLGSIRLYAQMLEQDLTDRPTQCAVATKIASAVRGLDAVVGDVLNFARDIRIASEPSPIRQLFSKALDACPDQKHVRIMKRGGAEDESSLEVWCDPALMHQALVNTIRNALEAMVESPEAEQTLTLDGARAVGHDGETAVVFTVSDTGPGIGAGVIDRMFNPFFTTRKTGTGLGLSIVHRIIDAHGGRVVVWNNADKAPDARGATFELVIPSRGAAPGANRIEPMFTASKESRPVRKQEASR